MKPREPIIFYRGRKFVVECAIRRNGKSESAEFLDGLDKVYRTKLIKIIRKFAEIGHIHNPEQFKKVEGRIYEFKEFQRRIFAFFNGAGCIVLTHGSIKKSNKAARKDITRANEIADEHIKNSL
jgi:phage-related protein